LIPEPEFVSTTTPWAPLPRAFASTIVEALHVPEGSTAMSSVSASTSVFSRDPPWEDGDAVESIPFDAAVPLGIDAEPTEAVEALVLGSVVIVVASVVLSGAIPSLG
jgi:hypothetical protein